ncbi:hypothetical protein [Halorussus halophilus]|uniref:hypothetical protein n=1 Tax=Halorussus halophilus TaxID=2650975 RepID=UPI001300E62E|nr:hypothetical protein [Halorussus halophilus]
MDEADLHERLEMRLTSHGVYVTDFEVTDETLSIEYETATPGGDGVPHREMGRVLNLLLDAQKEEWEPRDVEATVFDIDREETGKRGTWHAERDWLLAHEDGELSEVELSQRVLDTIEET